MSLIKGHYRDRSVYALDYMHVGLSVMIDNIRNLFENLHPFKSVYVSTYDKFIAGLQKIPVENSNIKHIFLFGNEGPRVPSLLIDPQQIEQDDYVSTLFFNFQKFVNLYGNLNTIEVFKTNLFTIKIGLSYLKMQFDVQAFMQSIYSKLDLDMKVYQLFNGINRVSEMFKNNYFIPIPSSMYDEMKLIDPNVEKQVMKIYFDYIGRDLPFVIFSYTPKVLLSSISDNSEKFGSELIPYYKSSYTIQAEGYVPTMMILELNYSYDAIIYPLSSSKNYSYLLVDSHFLFGNLLDLFKSNQLDIINYLASILLSNNIFTQDQLNELLSTYGQDNPLLLLMLFKSSLNLSYDDIQFLTEHMTKDIDKFIWLYDNQETVEQSLERYLKSIDNSFNLKLSDLDFDTLVMLFRKYESQMTADMRQLFLAYIFLRFLQKINNLTGKNYPLLYLITELSNNLRKQLDARDNILTTDENLVKLVIPVSTNLLNLTSCKSGEEFKNVVIDKDVDVGMVYEINVLRLFGLDQNNNKPVRIAVMNVSYDYDDTTKILKLYGPLKKGSIVTIIRF